MTSLVERKYISNLDIKNLSVSSKKANRIPQKILGVSINVHREDLAILITGFLEKELLPDKSKSVDVSLYHRKKGKIQS